ncbi:MAG: aminoglycoside phosphotransferase family protein [Bacteroidales bacterium]|nr:aminoglycoside phosphotransferase family protein [Bacteroidales bacterium]
MSLYQIDFLSLFKDTLGSLCIVAAFAVQQIEQLQQTSLTVALFQDSDDTQVLQGHGASHNVESRPRQLERRQLESRDFMIDNVPDKDTAIHGDLQFSNAIFVGDKRYFIDLGDFCYGNPLFDVGMVYLCCVLSDEAFIKETFHMDKASSIKFWESFAPAYFGRDRSLKDIEAEIRPFAGLKTLIVERDTRRPMPEFRACLIGIIS